MKEAFVDTSFLVAALNKHDALHERAREAMKRLARTRLVTTDFVFVELLNFYAERSPDLRTVAATTVEQWSASPNVVVIPASRAAYLDALRRYRERGDKQYSLTDCHSMLVMEERGITEALTHDEHFEQAGFRALLRDHA